VSPQQTIAHYRITSKLGEGGMGEVWRATDTKLSRDVAIKILPEAFASDPDRLARFTREAQVLASLNHPNIAAIYGVEDRALVMELVEGEDLRGPVPIETAIGYARQIVAALEAAHERGIVHRDLKPANVKVTPEGVVKLLDFGLAKAAEPAPSTSSAPSPTISPTLSIAMTQAGMLLGTAAYMAPEQARGKPVDKRADIWAFGVVLYELLTGKMLFGGGESATDVIAAVVTREPDWNALPQDTPPHLHRLLERCLRKDPKLRLRDIGEARIALEESAGPPEAPAPAPVEPLVRRPDRLLQTAAALLAITTLALGWISWRATHPPAAPMLRFSADLGPDAVAASRITVAISPDGARIVYPVRAAGATLLATRLLDQSKATVLSGTEGARDPFFSPSGQWIGFFAEDKLKKVSVQGGAPVTLCTTPSLNGDRGASWGEDGTIVATLDTRRMFRLPEAGGKPQTLPLKIDAADQASRRWPQILPGGEYVLFSTGITSSFDDATIAVASLKTGQVKPLVRGGYFGRYLPSGHLIYIHQGTLFGVRFHLRRLEIQGQPAPIQEEVAGNSTNGGGNLDFSPGPAGLGTLVYLDGKNPNSLRAVSWMEASGKLTPLMPPVAATFTPRLSPDGKTVALSVSGDIFTYDAQRGAMSRITFDSANSRFPVWTPDGKHIVYAPMAGGIWWTRADGSAQPQHILDTPSLAAPGSFSPDGRRLAYYQIRETAARIWILPLDTTDPDRPKPGKPEPIPASSEGQFDPAFSPDGRWLAYASTESNQYQLYVRPYPADAGSGKWQVSTDTARFPIWSRNGKELFFESGDGHIMVVEYTVKGETFTPGKPRRWSETSTLVTAGVPNYDLAPDGKRFVVFPEADSGNAARTSVHVTFLLNFFDELKRRLP
jgi:serine/threonine-protein kinase